MAINTLPVANEPGEIAYKHGVASWEVSHRNFYVAEYIKQAEHQSISTRTTVTPYVKLELVAGNLILHLK